MDKVLNASNMSKEIIPKSQRFVTSTSQGQTFQKFEEHPKSVRVNMADLAGR